MGTFSGCIVDINSRREAPALRPLRCEERLTADCGRLCRLLFPPCISVGFFHAAVCRPSVSRGPYCLFSLPRMGPAETGLIRGRPWFSGFPLLLGD